MEELTTDQLKAAAERVREMQRKATLAGGGKMPPAPDFMRGTRQNRQYRTSEQANPPSEKRPEAPPSTANSANKLLQMLNFKNFEINSDTSLLLGIIFLLSSSAADEMLILALIYIML